MPGQTSVIADKQGRPIDIDHRLPGWKITPRQRDAIYQSFLVQFPERNCTSPAAGEWIRIQAKQRKISAKRIRDFIGEGLAAEDGTLDRSWGWWIGCSLHSEKPNDS